MKVKKNKRAWRRTNDIRAHAPTFEINCRHCRIPMILRYSQFISKKGGNSYAVMESTNQIAMKCERCGSWIPFNVNYTHTGYTEESEHKYLKKILKLRKGKRIYKPTTKEWKNESKEIAKQLETLGYFGGR